MWCRHCQQDIPAIGPVTAYGARCSRCHRTMDSPADSESAETKPLPEADPTARREIERQLQSAQNAIAAGKASSTLRWDTGMLDSPMPFSQQAESTNVNQPAIKPAPLKRPSVQRSRQARKPNKNSFVLSQVVGWISATVGTATLGLGLGLLVWSLLQENTTLWSYGLGATVAGQSLMIVGLISLLSNLWAAARHTNAKLAQIHDDLHRVRRTTEQTAGNQHATATGFYAEMAANAEPDVLLGNLRGQLDQLSARLRFDQ